MSDAGGKILPIPDTPHARLIDKATARRRPFDAKGDGYRDALVWDSLLELLELGPDPAVLISNDHAAFSAKKEQPQLASDLVDELREHGSSGRVALYFDLAGFTAELPTARRLAEEWTHVLTQNRDFAEALTAYLIQLAQEDAARVIGTGIPAAYIRNPRFTGFENPRDLRVAEVWVSPDNSAILDVSLTFDGIQEVGVPAPELPPGALMPVTIKAPITLKYEILQHDRNEFTKFGGRLVDSSVPRA